MLWSLFKKVGILPLSVSASVAGSAAGGIDAATPSMARAENETETVAGEEPVKILKKGHAMRVIFFYPGEEGTYVDNAQVTLYENGIVHIRSAQEETTTMLQNCEILWNFELEADERGSKVRLLKPKLATIENRDKNPEPPSV